jgi:dipeptidyl aminopeptidase/acylaminoacyl peptidase
MGVSVTRSSTFSIRLLPFVFFCLCAQASAGRPFTVAEEIGLAHFGDPYGAEAESVQKSPDGHYIAALIERGRMDLDRPEDTLRIYRLQEVRKALTRPNSAPPPAPLWSFSRSTAKDGPIVTRWRWLADSSGIAFLERGANGNHRLMLADLKKQVIEPLTPSGQSVLAFDVRDRQHYVYEVLDPALFQRADAENKAPAIVGTGRSLDDLLFPADQDPSIAANLSDRGELWAVVGTQLFKVKVQGSDQALVLFTLGQLNMALSPDGESLVAALAVAEVPAAWTERYPPAFAASPYRLRAGKQDLSTFSGSDLVSQYVVVELGSGAVRVLSEGPVGTAAAWDAGGVPSWSPDGQWILLPNLLVASDTASRSHACVAVVRWNEPNASCVEPLKGPSETGSYEKSRYVEAVNFEGPDGHEVRVNYTENGGDKRGNTLYRKDSSGSWVVTRQSAGSGAIASADLELTIAQGLNAPPLLRATDPKTGVTRVLWDPNPQLKDITLGEATVYTWKDKAGRNWKGGLFKPVPYEPGRRYPLVIQTHGFSANEFRPSGVFPTAFAARALAASGLVVLQADMCPILSTPEEGPCNVDGFEAAVHKLVSEGLVDPERVGMIGFSRTCFHVMQALTASHLHIKAASITDGVMEDYSQYLFAVDMAGDGMAREADAIIGARPFGAGLQQWIERSPLSNIEKVSAALLVVAEGRYDLAFMWGPYAAMRYLHKPVDLILLNNSEHVLSNPTARMASQGGSVDWFRFWLQDYEDPDPAKVEQYRRWESLRTLQSAQRSASNESGG